MEEREEEEERKENTEIGTQREEETERKRELFSEERKKHFFGSISKQRGATNPSQARHRDENEK